MKIILTSDEIKEAVADYVKKRGLNSKHMQLLVNEVDDGSTPYMIRWKYVVSAIIECEKEAKL